MLKITQIKSLAQFKRLAGKRRGLSYFVSLNFGLRSSKHAQYYPSSSKYEIEAYIDGTRAILSEKNFLKSITMQAITAGACYAED